MRYKYKNVFIGIIVMAACAFLIFTYTFFRNQNENMRSLKIADASKPFFEGYDNKNIILYQDTLETEYGSLDVDVAVIQNDAKAENIETDNPIRPKPLMDGSIVEIVKTCYIKADVDWKSGDPVIGKAASGETYTHMSALDGNGHYAIALDDGSIGYIANKCGILK